MIKKHISPIIIVEGKYDKIKLDSLFDGLIFSTDGFEIFKNKNRQELLKQLAIEKGAIILTDSDRAGFMIRKYLHDILKNCTLHDVYIPDIYGKEKRKDMPSAEGKLGVEGIPSDIIVGLLENYQEKSDSVPTTIREYDLFQTGLFGKSDSAETRRAFQKYLCLPERLNKNMFLKILNQRFTHQQFIKMYEQFKKSADTLS